ncbi:hypothetical protein SteCoe_2584 [Stentor coeruleus]|uniref:Protein kinase domain-containing protein n=1 Tax=Stentor coeruleus TaxID=5963 RepID=A0A1R2CZ23_9CILI|nr:hypothetical protein SteCoe_2584 [Stentor coeruleus]
MDSDQGIFNLVDFFTIEILNEYDIDIFFSSCQAIDRNPRVFRNLLVYLIIPKACLNTLKLFKNWARSNQDPFQTLAILETRIKSLKYKMNNRKSLSKICREPIEDTIDKNELFNKTITSSFNLLREHITEEENENYPQDTENEFNRTITFNISLLKNSSNCQEGVAIEKYDIKKIYPFSNNIISKAKIKYKNKSIGSLAILIENCVAFSDREKRYYEMGIFPKFYGHMLKIHEKIPICLVFLEEAKEVLKENILAFCKKKNQEKAKLRDQRILQAFQLYKDLISDLKKYKKCGIDYHLDICPENILVYSNPSFPGGLKYKLVNSVFEYRRVNKSYLEGIALNKEGLKVNKKYLPPEIASCEYYYKKFESKRSITNLEARDVWSCAACVLSMITDKMIDKWGNLNFESSLAAIVIKEFTGYENIMECILKSLSLNFTKRPSIEELAQVLEINDKLV